MKGWDLVEKLNKEHSVKDNLKIKFIIYSIIWFLTIAALISSYFVLSANIKKVQEKNDLNTSYIEENKAEEAKAQAIYIPKVEEKKINYSLSNKVSNIAVFGLDERAEVYDGDWARADTMMIVTIDEKNSKIKLSSILRDCYVDVLEYGNIVKDKINHSFAYGASEEYDKSENPYRAYHAGALRSVKALNDNFDLNIKDYVIINFTSFKNIIDKIGGIEVNLTDEEAKEVNGAMGEFEVYGKFSKLSEGGGVKLLDGNQALAYARNRNIGGDPDRALRQRIVIQAMYKKMKFINPIQLTSVIKELMAMIKTNLTTVQIVSFATKVLFNDMLFVNTRFPVDNNWYGDIINGISYDIIDDEELNIKQIKDFIYNDILPEEIQNGETTTAPQ